MKITKAWQIEEAIIMAKFLTWQQFMREWQKLTPQQRQLFAAAWRAINASLNAGRGLPPPPFVQKITDYDVYEVRWDANGRATFHIDHTDSGEIMIVWRRIGDHKILKNP